MESGPKQLQAWISKRFTNPRTARIEAAEYLGINYFQLSHYLGGGRGIGMDNALLIEEKTGIPVKAWASQPQDKSKTQSTVGVRKRRLA